MLNLIKFSQYFRGGGKLVTRGGGNPRASPPLNETLLFVFQRVQTLIFDLEAVKLNSFSVSVFRTHEIVINFLKN